MLVPNRSSPSISDCIFLQRVLEIKSNYQALDGRLIEVTTIGELWLRWPNGGRGWLMGVAA